jgi:vitamin B12 transporter
VNRTIVVSNVGYKPVEQKITIGVDTAELFFCLKRRSERIKSSNVTAGSFEAGDKKRAATVLSSLDVVTTGGANADISAVVKTLPGAQQVGEQEGLFVRGGAGYETKQFIDGTMVNNPYFSSVPDLAQRGRFSPFLFKGTVFSTGGYSALYGQALSSALILESIDIPDRSEAQLSISPIFVGGGLQKIAKDKKSSWGVGMIIQIWLLTSPSLNKHRIILRCLSFMQLMRTSVSKQKKAASLNTIQLLHTNHLGLRRPNIDDPTLKNAFELKNTNWYNNLSWRENLGHGWKMNLGLSYSTDHNKIPIIYRTKTMHRFQQGWFGSTAPTLMQPRG